MRKGLVLAVACLAIGLLPAAPAWALPAGFFGIAPQTDVGDADAQYMSAGGIESVRVPVYWPAIQPAAGSPYQWQSLDRTVAVASRAGLGVLPFLLGTPTWLEGKPTTLPVGDGLERHAWSAFVRAAVERYGPTGSFWQEHGPYSADPVPMRPIRVWQIWNEANFHYFAYPVSPRRYAKLLEITAPEIHAVDADATVLLAGLFGRPDERGSHGMPASSFLTQLYRIPGARDDFDAVALHPYAANLGVLKRLVKATRRVVRANHDSAAPLYITELGWGSQNNSKVVAFEKGMTGQVRELKGAYRYLIGSRSALKLRGVYWFSWKDIAGACSFCDSVGFFRAGPGFQPKPAWQAFVELSGGRAQP